MTTQTSLKIIFSVFLSFVALFSTSACEAARKPLFVGNVNFVRPTEKATIIEATVESLRKGFSNRDVQMVEIPVNRLDDALNDGKIDIFITSAGQSFRLQQKHGTRVLGTLVTKNYPDPNHSEGAAIFVRRDSSLQTLKDLKGKSLIANTPVAFTGFHVPMGEIAKIDADWENFFSSMKFVGGGAALGEALASVAEGQTDVAFARLCYFETWAKSHPELASKLRVINSQTQKGEACVRSTELYPDWTVTATGRLTPEEARTAALAIMNMPPDEHGNTWGVATDYLHVDHLYRSLRLGKYRYLRDWTLTRFLNEYWPALALLLLSLLGLILHSWRTGYLVRRRTSQLQALMARQNNLQEKAREASEHLAALQKMGALGQVSGMLAHEMKQPLATISFYLDGLKLLLGKGVIGPEDHLKEPLEEIERQTKKANDIVEHARQYARTAKSGSRRTWVHFSSVLNQTIENYRVSRRRPPFIQKDLSAADVWIKVDPLEMECVVFNLLKNAGEAAETVMKPTLRILTRRQGNCVRVTVIDNGPALTDADFQKILGPPGPSLKAGGLGFGLSIVRGLLEAYGSKLVFERRSAGGLQASFELPCRDQKPQEKENPVS